MVVEVGSQTEDQPNFLFRYDKNQPEMGRCENCYHEKVLKAKCPCGKANYCSQECRQSDENYHIKTCEYLNKVDINKIDFSMVDPMAANGRQGLVNLGNTCYMNSAL